MKKKAKPTNLVAASIKNGWRAKKACPLFSARKQLQNEKCLRSELDRQNVRVYCLGKSLPLLGAQHWSTIRLLPLGHSARTCVI